MVEIRPRRLAGSVVVRGLPVAEMRTRRLDDLGEADHRDRIIRGDGSPIDLFEEGDLLLEPAELGVVVLDVARRELGDPLDLDVVDYRGEDLLAWAMTETNGDPDDLAALILVALVTKSNRRCLAATLELV